MLVALVFLLLCFFVGWRVLLYREINRQFAQIRAAGFPTSGAELNSWLRPLPDSENGALVLTQAFALMRTLPDIRSNAVTKDSILARTNQWSPETFALTETYVQTNMMALARAGEALGFRRFRYPVDYTYGPDSDMTHLDNLKTLAQIAGLRASLDAAKNRGEDWPAQVEFQLRLAATLEGEPTLLPHLTRNTVIRTAIRTMERNLAQASPGREVCQRLQHAFAYAGRTNLLPFVLATERAAFIPVFRLSWQEIHSHDQGDQGESRPRQRQRFSGKPALVLWLPGIFERDLNLYLQTMEECISLAASSPRESLVLTNVFEKAVQVAREKDFLPGLLFPAMSRAAVRVVSASAHIEVAKTALAIECFRHDQGRLPEDLQELTPRLLQAIPNDPFDGAPLRYRRLAKGYVVYSIGSDGHDDGGREEPPRKKHSDNTSYDITFTVER